jgi:hypothetical protein
MVEAQGASVEAALWSALEMLEERGELLQRMADRLPDAPRSQRRFQIGADEAHARAALIRRTLAIGVQHAHDDEPQAAAG